MNYNEFLEIINNNNITEELYIMIKEKLGSEKTKIYFEKYMDTCEFEETAYEKCKYFLEEHIELNNTNYDYVYNGYVDSSTQYINEISQIDLLSPDEEKEILTKIIDLKEQLTLIENKNNINELQDKYGKDLNYLLTLKKDNSEKKEELNILINYLCLKKEHSKLINLMMEANLRLVIHVAKYYKLNTRDYLDIVQEGNLGLKEAIIKFDFEKGNRFSTYATWWIRQRIIREIQKNSKDIRIPCHVQELRHKIKKLTELYQEEYELEPTDEELFRFIKDGIKDGAIKNCILLEDLSIDQLKDLKKSFVTYTSIYTKVGEEDDTELLDFIPDEDVKLENIVIKNSIQDSIKSFFSTLDIRYKMILVLRFGFSLDKYLTYEEFLSCIKEKTMDNAYYEKLYKELSTKMKVYTLHEIGNVLSVSRERVRQMEAKGLRLLRNKNNRENILQRDLLDLYK